MPPKKAAAAAKDDAAVVSEDIKFTWTVENERKLLLLCMSRPNLAQQDYHDFVKALPAGANFNGVRIKVSKMRIEQRAIYAAMGWPTPDGKTTDATVSKGRKRAASAANDEKPDKPAKKPRSKKSAAKVEEADDQDEDGPTNGISEVKEEFVDEI